MKIWTHLYRLPSRRAPALERLGVLLRVEWAPSFFGYSDLHPYPEFGEAPLSEQLEGLVNLRPTSLADFALEFSYVDFTYRKRQRSAFLGLPLPACHRLIFLDEAPDPRHVEGEGFTHVKLKMGQHLQDETEYLRRIVRETTLWLRLDFNARLTALEFESWWSALEPAVKLRIDFIEDPAQTDPLHTPGPWAEDWRSYEGAEAEIVKPMRQKVSPDDTTKRVIFTHSLEHALGRSASLWAAARFYRRHPGRAEVCGLGDAGVYLADEFSRSWPAQGPRIKPPPGLGFGFDEQLHAVEWERIV